MRIWKNSHKIYALADAIVPSASARHAPSSSKSKSILSMNNWMNLSKYFWNTSFIKLINTPGEFVSPNGKKVNS
jgi:hypothetical protein